MLRDLHRGRRNVYDFPGPLHPTSADEDRCRVRTGHAGQNLAAARHWALNLLKQERTARVGIKAKRKKAGWDYPYLLKVLSP